MVPETLFTALYTSPKIQNDIINIMANMERQQICTSVQRAGYYCIVADETKDMSKQEQLPLSFVTLMIILIQ